MKKYFLVLFCLLVIVFAVGCGTSDTLPEIDLSAPLDAYHIQGTLVTEWQPSEEDAAVIQQWYTSLEVKHKIFKKDESPADVEGGEVYNFSNEKNEFSYVVGADNYILVNNEWYLVKNPSLPSVEIPDTYGNAEEETKYAVIPMVKIDGEYYYSTGKKSDALRCGVMDGEITSSVESTEKPTEDNQSNFGCYGYQLGAEEGTIEVNIDDEWVIFEKRGGDGSTVKYNGRWYDKSDLSQETLEWLEWYNDLSQEAQQAVSFVPQEFINID